MNVCLDEDTKELYNKALGKIEEGFCPICNEALTSKNYCPKHSYIRSSEQRLIGQKNYDQRILEIATGGY